MQKPAAEVEITHDLLRRLLRDQAPAFAEEPIELVAAGWDNEIHRLGAHHAIRLPRRSVAAPLVDNEQRWLPELEPRLPLPIPAPRVVGRPGHGFPWGWSIVPWYAGESIGASPGTVAMAEQLGQFLLALHQPGPVDAPANPFRGGPLHGRNERHLSAVIDFGDITAGDPATDYLMGWMTFDAPERAVFRRTLQADDATWNRGQAWALALSLVFAAQGDDDPGMFSIGQAGIRRVLDDIVA